MSNEQKLPELPMLVLVKSDRDSEPEWCVLVDDMRHNSYGLFRGANWGVEYDPADLEVIPHPRNDPRAVELITAARNTPDTRRGM